MQNIIISSIVEKHKIPIINFVINRWIENQTQDNNLVNKVVILKNRLKEKGVKTVEQLVEIKKEDLLSDETTEDVLKLIPKILFNEIYVRR